MSSLNDGNSRIEGSQIRKYVFLLLFLALFLLVARLFYPFITVILWSGLIYAILSGVYERAVRRRDWSERGNFAKTILAGAFALCAVILFVVPALLLAWAVLRQVGELAGGVLDTLNKNPGLLDLSPSSAVGGFVYSISDGQIDLSGIHLVDEVKRFVASRSGSIIGFSGALIRDAASLLVNLAFMVFTLYFFFADGKYLMRTFVGAIPIERAYTTIFIRKFKEAGKQLLLGNFLVGLFQGTMMLIIGLAFGVKGYLVYAALTVIASFIPMVGTSLVWLPLTAGFALGGELGKAALFFVLSGTCVALLDNFLRPFILHERLKIHPLLIFFSILGGIVVFGFNGLVLGPLVLILFFSALELYEGIDGTMEDSPHRRRKEDMEEDRKKAENPARAARRDDEPGGA